MNDYLTWLALTRKWATGKLAEGEYQQWDRLSAQLNKHCPEEGCGNGEECERCGNLGLILTESELKICKEVA